MEIVVITNGTVLPNAELLSAMRHPKVMVQISDYGAHAQKDLLMTMLRENHTKCWLFMQKWYELSAFRQEELAGEELNRVVTGCCKLGGNGDPYLIDGVMYRCPIQAHLHRLGIFKSDPTDYVDLRQTDSHKLQEEVSAFINVKEPVQIVKLCRHCNGRGYTGIEVPPAEQLKPWETIQVRFE